MRLTKTEKAPAGKTGKVDFIHLVTCLNQMRLNEYLCTMITENKLATTLDEQIQLLRSRGVEISDADKAKECLSDIGYYRLCFYLFPFEESYPKLENRSHIFVEGTKLSDAVSLYYFDFDLRNILNRYLCRIEVAFRTYIIYTLSNKYKQSPTWFVNPAVMQSCYIKDFDSVYSNIRKKPVIKRHHKKYINDKYAPAWKTLEYMTFGNIKALYVNLRCLDDRLDICRHFGVNQTSVFENYLQTIIELRNICAHGGVLFDLHLPQSIKNGPAGKLTIGQSNRLYGAIKVIDFLIGQISVNRQEEMKERIDDALKDLYHHNAALENIVKKTAGPLQIQK